MSYFPGSDLLAALSGSGPDDTLLVPGLVLFPGRPRPIFLSDALPDRQRQMLAFFTNSRRRFLAGALSLRMGRAIGATLSRIELPLPSHWQSSLHCDLAPLALYCGSPGPLQKVTLLMPSAAQGGSGVVVKVSLRPTADEAVGNESTIIESLGDLPETLRSSLPRLIDLGQLPSGRRYLATVAAGGQVIGADQFPACAPFLRDLGRSTRVDHPWGNGPAMLATRAALERARGRTMVAAVYDLLSRALDRVDTQLGSATVPHVLAHGDFTRFNIRGDSARYSVFDWEYARHGANPIADVMHFHLSQPGGWSPLTVMHHTLAVAEHMIAGAYEGWEPSARDLAALALHTLVDTMTFYSNAGAPLDLESFVVRRYLGLIGASAQWGLE